MKVIFLQDVGGVRRAAVKEVSDGYALNYLFPRGLAVRATPEKLAALSQKSQGEAREQAKAEAAARGRAAELSGKVVTVRAKAASSGKLYAALPREAVVQAIHDQLHVPVEPGQLQPTDHLKAVGSHGVAVVLHPEVSARVTVNIEPV